MMADFHTWRTRVPPSWWAAAQTAAPLYRALLLWDHVGGLRMSAAMAFYGLLSLAPLLMLLVGLLGWWIDRELLTQGLMEQIGGLIGERGMNVVREALVSVHQPSEGLLATGLGFGVLLFGATGVFSELQDALQRLWRPSHSAAPHAAWWSGASMRLRGIGYVLVFGFLLVVSLAVSALLALFANWLGQSPVLVPVLEVLNETLAFAICAALFFGLMRLSGGAKPRSRHLLMGAVLGAALFTGGRQLLVLYLSKAAAVSAYGAAGSLVVLMLWMYFSSAVLLLGAACAKAMENVEKMPVARADTQAV